MIKDHSWWWYSGSQICSATDKLELVGYIQGKHLNLCRNKDATFKCCTDTKINSRNICHQKVERYNDCSISFFVRMLSYSNVYYVTKGKRCFFLNHSNIQLKAVLIICTIYSSTDSHVEEFYTIFKAMLYAILLPETKLLIQGLIG